MRQSQCKACGGTDCPTVSADPFWRRCPADPGPTTVATLPDSGDEQAARAENVRPHFKAAGVWYSPEDTDPSTVETAPLYWPYVGQFLAQVKYGPGFVFAVVEWFPCQCQFARENDSGEHQSASGQRWELLGDRVICFMGIPARELDRL